MAKKSSLLNRERISVSRIHQLIKEPGLLRASIVQMKRKCGGKNCHCTKGKLHKSWYLYQSNKGKSRMLFIPDNLAGEAKEWVKKNREIRKLLDKVSQIYWDRIKNREV